MLKIHAKKNKNNRVMTAVTVDGVFYDILIELAAVNAAVISRYTKDKSEQIDALIKTSILTKELLESDSTKIEISPFTT